MIYLAEQGNEHHSEVLQSAHIVKTVDPPAARDLDAAVDEPDYRMDSNDDSNPASIIDLSGV